MSEPHQRDAGKGALVVLFLVFDFGPGVPNLFMLIFVRALSTIESVGKAVVRAIEVDRQLIQLVPGIERLWHRRVNEVIHVLASVDGAGVVVITI